MSPKLKADLERLNDLLAQAEDLADEIREEHDEELEPMDWWPDLLQFIYDANGSTPDLE